MMEYGRGSSLHGDLGRRCFEPRGRSKYFENLCGLGGFAAATHYTEGVYAICVICGCFSLNLSAVFLLQYFVRVLWRESS